MARGWESKSVELQQSTAAETGKPSKKRLNPEQIQQQNQKRSTQLAVARVRHELETAQNPRYQEMLKAELAVLEKRLAKLD